MADDKENCRGLYLDHRWAPGEFTGYDFCTKCGEMRGKDSMTAADKRAYVEKFSERLNSKYEEEDTE